MSDPADLAVIFDLDGTLVDSEPNYYEAGRLTLAKCGVPECTWAEHERHIGISTLDTIVDWHERYGLRAPAAELLAAKNRHHLELARTSTRAYPEMRGFVDLLAAEGVPMAVASGSSPEAIAAVLAGTGLDARLRALVSADEVAHSKSAPGSWRPPAASGRTRRTAWWSRTPRRALPPPTRPGCAASPSPTSPPRRTTPRSRAPICWCGAVSRSSQRGRRAPG